VIRAVSVPLTLGCALALGWAVAWSGCATRPIAAPARSATPATPAPSAAAKPAASKIAKHRRRGSSSTAAHMVSPGDAEATPAVRYAQLSQADCEAELTRRNIGFARETAEGVLAPVRLLGPLHGVAFRTDQSAAQRETSPYEVADCRLVLALDDFTEVLRSHDIVEVRHYSMWRPPKHWPDGKIGTRHDGALALDAGRFIDSTGAVLDVDHDFHGAIDAKTCGDGAGPRPATPAGIELRAILCEAVDRRLFNVVLTPNYNRPHKNHFHLEVTAGAAWFLVH
jgi:hypothetical protein